MTGSLISVHILMRDRILIETISFYHYVPVIHANP
jgi:hypothetical protein